MSNGMKNQWLIGVIIAGVIVAIFVVFNYQGKQDGSLNDIFPEDAAKVPETEYEYVTDAPAKAPEAVKAPVKAAVSAAVAAPVATKVQPAAVTSAAAPAVAASATAVSGTYSIQVLSSKDKAATDKALEKIKAKGHAAYIVTKDLADKGIWYRINVGSFASKQEAETYLTNLKVDYKDGFIVYTK